MGLAVIIGFIGGLVAMFLMNSNTAVIEFARNLTASWPTLSALADTSNGFQGLIYIIIFSLACCTSIVTKSLKNRCRGNGLPSPQQQTRPSEGPENVEQPIPRRSSTAKEAAQLCKEALKTLYKTTGSFVQLIPWADDDKKHIMDIYTDLELESTYGKKEMVDSYEDILHRKTKEGDPIKRIICKGLPGYGKSTLLDKIAYDWAVGSVQALLKYELVIVLKMGALQQHSDLVDAIFDQLLDEDTPVNRSALKSFINSNPDKLLILLDGFDEFLTIDLVETSFGSILKMLNRKETRECCAVVTTRPSHFHKLVSRSLIENPFTHVNVLGFNNESVQKYANKFYSENPDDAHELLNTIQSTDVLYELARSPMLVLLMCLLWRDDSKLPDTLTRLYEKALRYIFRRKSKDLSDNEISQTVVQLGKIALEGLLYPKQMLSFRERAFEGVLLDVALKVGLLTKQRVLKVFDAHNTVQFIHKTFQEFCGAKYLQHLLKVDYKEFQKILKEIQSKVTENPEDFDYLLRFGCGDHASCTGEILNIFRENAYHALNYCFECQANTLLFEDFIASVFRKCILLRPKMKRLCHSFFWLLKRVADDGSTSYLTNVQDLSIMDWDVHRYADELRCGLRKLTQLQGLHLEYNSLTGSNMNVIAQSFKHLGNLTRLHIDYNPALRGSFTAWTPDLQVLKNLRTLTFKNCGLDGRDVISMATICGKMRNIDLCTANTGPDYHIVKSMKMLSDTDSPNDKSLMLQGCPLAGDALVEMFESLGGRGDIVEVLFMDNGDATADTQLWAPNLKTLKQVRQLSLTNLNLQSADMKHISSAVGDLPTLATLILNANKSLGGCVKLWATDLQKLRFVKMLELSDCSLTRQDIPHIVESLSTLPCLETLDVHDNDLRGCTLIDWSRLTNLKMLILPWNLRTDVSEIQRHMPNTCVTSSD
ncbi:NACHT, LRR and PYD domains-containing protein 8-like [Patiria miniata]|uniref:NACHT domain-containing protein n=1 Tax=Patiria miniata TaxID=46514 RepID=A0A913ZRU8_PATMI|nr:NACHT, LRR and PYD domains-containing protein 8-like [Patiria miniata]